MPKYIILFDSVWTVNAENKEDAERKYNDSEDTGVELLYSGIRIMEDINA